MTVTRDSIAMRGAGIVHIAQPAKGHRFTLDSILLADFCRVKPTERVLEPGAGTGVISLLLAKKHPRSFFYPVEIQEDLHSLCEKNREANDLKNVIPFQGDIRELPVRLRQFDTIIANPPYVKTGTGRTSPLSARKIAREDRLARIELWLDLRKFLKPGGGYNIIFPAGRAAELTSLMRTRKLEPKRIRFVHPYEDKPASLVLIEAVKDGGIGLAVLPPLIVHGPGGSYTAEMAEIYGL